MKTNLRVAGLPETTSLGELPAIATDGKRRIVFVNRAAECLLGLRGKEVLGCDLSAVLSLEAMGRIAGATVLRIPAAVLKVERSVYILKPANHAAEFCPLSRREREIVAFLCDGYAALNIAARLNLSHATVRNHIQNALRKIEVHSQVELVALSLRRGWIDRQEPTWNTAFTASPRAAEAMAAGG